MTVAWSHAFVDCMAELASVSWGLQREGHYGHERRVATRAGYGCGRVVLVFLQVSWSWLHCCGAVFDRDYRPKVTTSKKNSTAAAEVWAFKSAEGV